MESVVFELSQPLKYTGQSGEIEASFIELREPTGKVSHICCEVESLIQSALMRMSDIFGDKIQDTAQNTETADKKLAADDALMLMTTSGVDMQKIVLHFRDLFKTVAYMGGEKQMTVPRMDDMTHSDFKKMIGTYVGNFILS